VVKKALESPKLEGQALLLGQKVQARVIKAERAILSVKVVENL